MPLVARFTLDSVVRFSTFVLVAITAVLLGRLTWAVLEPASILPAADAPSTMNFTAETAPVRGGFAELASLSVFGTAAAKTGSRALNAPETSLSWSLKGVLSDPDPSRSAAILLPQGQSEKLYRVGASLPGDVTLQEVLADRVILNRGGRLETLRLKRHDTAGSTAGNRRAPALPSAQSAALAADGGEPRIDRDAWVDNPQRFLDVISANPVMQDGALYGLEVSPARNAREFEAAGLVAGDVITEVNGSPVADITDYRDLLKELADASSVSVSLERNGEPMNITISMD